MKIRDIKGIADKLPECREYGYYDEPAYDPTDLENTDIKLEDIVEIDAGKVIKLMGNKDQNMINRFCYSANGGVYTIETEDIPRLLKFLQDTLKDAIIESNCTKWKGSA